jgi:hypothetical protein
MIMRMSAKDAFEYAQKRTIAEQKTIRYCDRPATKIGFTDRTGIVIRSEGIQEPDFYLETENL